MSSLNILREKEDEGSQEASVSMFNDYIYIGLLKVYFFHVHCTAQYVENLTDRSCVRGGEILIFRGVGPVAVMW